MIRTAILAAALGLAACQSSTPAAAPAPEKKPAPAAEVKAAPAAEAAAPKAAAAPRTIELKVTENGFEPTPITVKKGEPLKLVITRTEKKTCATEIVVPGYDIEQKLPLNETVTVEFTPLNEGELKYGCAMGQMIAGVLMVE